MTGRDWSDLSRYPVDPTPAEVLENVQACAEAIVANCRVIPSLQSIEGLHTHYATIAVLGKVIHERGKLLRGGKGGEAL